jgi:hypothetical protein
LAGLPNSNVEGDLKVEHQNLEFKTGLLNLAGWNIKRLTFWYISCIIGNYTDPSIQRVAKSMNMAKVLREKLVPQYKDG